MVGAFASLYFFPFSFTFLPGVNTKMMLAVLGLFILGVQLGKGQNAKIDKDFFILSVWAALFSLVCLFSITINGTPDYAYATYFVSMWVWLGAAYAVCTMIKGVHGVITIELLTKYLAAVCLFQCFAAILIDNNQTIKQLVDAYISQGQDFLTEVKRLYGIGANLDVAGSRFSVVLVLLIHLFLKRLDNMSKLNIVYNVIAFWVIAIIGNMIARTTTVGLIIALLYLGYVLFIKGSLSAKASRTILWSLLGATLIFIPLGIYLYDASPFFHKQIRFAFEGVFSLVEKGTWEVSSNERLKTMYVFPETFKTWMMGDGYFSSPRDVDPYFTGKLVGGYYMGTDVGYLRFIFYSGLIGLVTFSTFIIKTGQICMRKFPAYKQLFLMILAINFIVWFKVSTDIFLAFALFLMISKEDNEAYEERYLTKL